MTDKQTILRLLESYYSDVMECNYSLFRCTRNFKEKPYQIVYFDLSGNYKDIDLADYLKQHISGDYFKNPGILQWNYYLVFLTDQVIDIEKKSEIEQNNDFARKYVMPFHELTPWLDRNYNIDHSGSRGTTGTALSDIWLKALTQNNIDFIAAADLDPDTGIDLIIRGKKYNGKVRKNKANVTKDNDYFLSHLNYLKPTRYRDFPKTDDGFTFRSVNLISAPNGYGKTSLLEAIEYFVTGENSRISGSQDGYQIEVKFSSDNILRKFVNDKTIFHHRAKIWYNSSEDEVGSSLSSNFNKFNFYNTDASFRLSITKNESEIEEAFKDLAIGKDTKFLRQRMVDYKSLLLSELNLRETTLVQYQQGIHDDQQTINQLIKETMHADEIFDQLDNSINKKYLNISYGNRSLNELDMLKSGLSDLDLLMTTDFPKIDWTALISIKTLTEEHQRLVKVLNLISTELSGVQKLEGRKSDLEIYVNKNKEQIRLLQAYSLFVKADLLKLPKLFPLVDEERNDAQDSLYRAYLRLDFYVKTPIALSKKSIKEENQSLFNDFDRLKTEQSLLQSVILETRQNNFDTEQLMTRLERDIQQLLRIRPELFTCPVCLSDIPKAVNVSVILSTNLNTQKEKEGLKSLLKQRATIDKQVENIALKINELSGLNSVIRDLTTNDKLFDLPLVELFSHLRSDILRQLVDFGVDVDEVDALKKVCFKNRLDPRELYRIQQQLPLYFTFEEVNSLDKIKSICDRLQMKTNEDIEKVRKLNDQINNSQVEIDQALKEYDKWSSFREPLLEATPNKANNGFKDHKKELAKKEEILKTRSVIIDDFLKQIVEVPAVSIPYEADLKESALLIKKGISLIDRIRSDIAILEYNKQQIEKVRSVLDFKLTEVGKIEKARDRMIRVLTILERIESEHSEQAFLGDFLIKNNEKIKNVFQTIHSPKEFTGLSIINNKIYLNKVSGEIVDLKRVSTGQRAALGLSVYLALNYQLEIGPKMMLFDDPVTFTDDLNILSFLDHLREIVLSSHHQVFFATASEKLAFLFKKKFEFLEGDFNHIILER